MAGRVILKKFGTTKSSSVSVTRVFDITSAGIIKSTNVAVDTYTNLPPMPAPPTSGSEVLIFGSGITTTGLETRTATASSKVDLSQNATLSFYVNRGTYTDWGQTPDSNEELLLEYSTNGSTWVQIKKVAISVQKNTWLLQSVTIPSGAKISSGVFLRFKQYTSGDPARRDTWAVTSIEVTQLDVKYVYVMTPEFDANVTAYIWGGGGGAGSGDTGKSGGSSSPGLYNTKTFTVSKGDTIEVTIGQGGQGGVSGRPQIGGPGGNSRINVDGNSAHSFNGGKGGNGPVSGAGGGGGGATTILVNSQLVAVAGGGGGGGGAGNGGNGQNASIENNVMTGAGSITVQSSHYNITRDSKTVFIDVNGTHVVYGATRGHTLAVFNPSTLKLESKATYDTYGAQSSSALTTALLAVPDGKIIAIASFDATALGLATRNLLISQFGAPSADVIEYPKLNYSIWGKARISHAFIGVKNGSVTGVERWTNDSKDGIINITFNTGVTTPTDYRGQDGQSRNSDGGTGGAGGGGYPGGLGGKSNSGDTGGEAGQTGGNFPVSSASRGESSPYYSSSYGHGSPGDTGAGGDGYAILEIVPAVQYAAASAIKTPAGWKQVTAGYVKVSGTWEQIEAAYVKKNGSWKRIVSSGDSSSVTETASATNFGQVQRPYS